MKPTHNLIQPNTFYSETEYLIAEEPANPGASLQPVTLSPVKFIAHDVCPAFVIVRDDTGKRWRCPRHHLYTIEVLT